MKIPFFSKKEPQAEAVRREPRLISGTPPRRGQIALTAAKDAAVSKATLFSSGIPLSGNIAMDSAGRDCGALGAIKDNWTIGTMVADDAILGWFSSQFFLGYHMLSILAQNWLIQKACSMPARDAVRHGFERSISGISDDASKTAASTILDGIDKEFRLLDNCEELVRMGRVFGLRIMFFDFEFENDVERTTWFKSPFNLDGVKAGTYRGMRQVDPIWCKPMASQENLIDPSRPDFYEPTFWRIGQTEFHKSHLVIFRTDEVSDLLKPMYNFGGVSVPQKIYERVYSAERTANEAPALAMTKRLIVWKTDTETTLNNFDVAQEHLNNLTHLRDNYGVHMIDNEDDTQQLETNLTGFDEIVMNQFQLVAAASNVPATKLLGTTPKGFQSTGEHETKSYHEELETIQHNDLSAVIDRHYEIAVRSAFDGAAGLSASGVTISHSWNGVDSPTERENAETRKLETERDDALIMAGVITAEEVRERLSRDRNSSYYGIPIAGASPASLKNEVDDQLKELADLDEKVADENADNQ